MAVVALANRTASISFFISNLPNATEFAGVSLAKPLYCPKEEDSIGGQTAVALVNRISEKRLKIDFPMNPLPRLPPDVNIGSAASVVDPSQPSGDWLVARYPRGYLWAPGGIEPQAAFSTSPRTSQAVFFCPFRGFFSGRIGASPGTTAHEVTGSLS